MSLFGQEEITLSFVLFLFFLFFLGWKKKRIWDDIGQVSQQLTAYLRAETAGRHCINTESFFPYIIWTFVARASLSRPQVSIYAQHTIFFVFLQFQNREKMGAADIRSKMSRTSSGCIVGA